MSCSYSAGATEVFKISWNLSLQFFDGEQYRLGGGGNKDEMVFSSLSVNAAHRKLPYDAVGDSACEC